MENLGFFEKTVKVVDRYGGWRVLQSIILVALFLFTIFYIPAVTKMTVERATMESIETVDKNKEELHIKNLEKRKQMQPQINSSLEALLTSVKADRAFIIELHNGSNNLNGVPFLHGSVTYDKSIEGLENIDEEYQNLSLSRFNMSLYLHKNFNFIGSIDELNKIDKKLASKLQSNEVQYLAIITLHDGINEWGWFGVLYNRSTDIPSEKDILNSLVISSQTITKELNVLKE